ncbi:hypothetical protein D5W64_13090 [Salmonella enterica subsp. enterica serovar Saintpaul]|nr:hypothetical protein [Salmonella enterica subsp. enterica serovar Saintpaul]
MTEENKDVVQELKRESATLALTNALVGPADDDAVGLPLFLGTLKEEHQIIYKTGMIVISLRKAIADGRERDINILTENYREAREEHFPDVDEDMLTNMLVNYIRFYFNTLDRGIMRDIARDAIDERKVVNKVPLKNGGGLGLISAITPGNKNEGDVRSRMRRNFLRATGAPDSFNIILANSLIFMRVKVPTPLELVRLINDIVTQLHLYGERFNQTTIHLERAGICKIITDFVLDRLSYHSVKGVQDPAELKKYILSNDMNHIAQALLAIGSPKGVTYRMTCLAHKCGWTSNQVIDPTAMLLYVEEDQPEERRQLLYRLVNEGLKLSPEELAKNPPVYKDKEGNPLDTKVEFADGSGRLIINVPYLSEYFMSYDNMAAKVNPDLRDLAGKFPNGKVYEEKKKEYYAQMRGHEYLQWFSAYEMDPPPGVEGEKEVIYRSEDPKAFDEGLLDIFAKDEMLYLDALKKVIGIAPRMTYTFVGICNDECPKCKEKAENPITENLKNFTPIDPVMNFFDHTRMTIDLSTAQLSLQEELLS